MKKLKFVAGLVVVSVLAACGGGRDDVAERLNISAAKTRFINVAPTSSQVTLYRGDQAQSYARNIGYKSVSQYNDVGSGTATWSARQGGTDSDSSLASVTFESQIGKRNSVLLVGTSADYDAFVLTDPYGISPDTNRARIRVFNDSVNAQAFDVYVTSATTDLATVSSNFNNVGYRQFVPDSGSDSFEFDPGDYVVRLTAPGSKTVSFTAPLSLPQKTDWLLISLPNVGGVTTLNAIKFLTVQGSGDADGKTSEIVSVQ